MTPTQIRTTAIGLSLAALAMIAGLSTMIVRHDEVPAGATVRADAIGTTAAQPRISDQMISDALRRENVDIARLSVRSFNDIVILRGNADATTAERATNVVRSLGVQRVANLITPAAPDRDDEIRREAERELANAGSLVGARLAVTVDEGVLRVSGTVQNDYQRDAAASLVRGLRGVKSVKVDLAVATAAM